MNNKGTKTRRASPKPVVKRCQYCIYWEAVESNGDHSYRKTCHRYPPQIYVWNLTRMHERPKTHTAEWCGEFACRFATTKSKGR